MIFEYDNTGFITTVYFDPVPQSLIDMYVAEGKQFKNFPPVPLPAVPVTIDYTNDLGMPAQRTEMQSPGGEPVPIDPTSDWFNIAKGKLEKRPTFGFDSEIQLTVGQTKTLTGLPTNTIVQVYGQSYPITDGKLELGGEMAGSYEIYIDAFPYMPTFIQVTVK